MSTEYCSPLETLLSPQPNANHIKMNAYASRAQTLLGLVGVRGGEGAGGERILSSLHTQQEAWEAQLA